MSYEIILMLLVAGFIAGGVNALAGGATLLTFPVLMAAGLVFLREVQVESESSSKGKLEEILTKHEVVPVAREGLLEVAKP